MDKLVVVINGSGGVGKDLFVELASIRFRCMNVSSIAPVKELAEKCGWTGKKEARDRKFLSDLKATLVEYNDLPFKYLAKQLSEFVVSENQIMFCHIRELEEIDKFISYVKSLYKIPCVTLLISRPDTKEWGNKSDDDIDCMKYDFHFLNDYDHMLVLEKAMMEYAEHLWEITQKYLDFYVTK